MATLYVCTTCRAGGPGPEAGPVPGRLLHEALAALLPGHAPGLELREVTCLASCEQGCSAAIAGTGKWTVLLGGLAPALAADLLAYAQAYAAAPTGMVMPSRRPASLRGMVLGRVPADPASAAGAAGGDGAAVAAPADGGDGTPGTGTMPGRVGVAA